jgi:hypothetical protein
MPPTFAYSMCLIAYLALMASGMTLCVPLLWMPSKRHLFRPLALAILGSLPGVLVGQFLVGIPLGVLVGAVLGFYAIVDPPEWVQWSVGLPTLFLVFATVVGASLVGGYSGGRMGWEIGRGTVFTEALCRRKIVRLFLLYFRR